MAVSVCPIAVVQAPAERVWSLLSDPARFDLWWEARTVSITPPGPAQPGQAVAAVAHGLGHDWPVHFTVNAVDPVHRALDLNTRLPFGISLHNHLTVMQVDVGASRVTFG